MSYLTDNCADMVNTFHSATMYYSTPNMNFFGLDFATWIQVLPKNSNFSYVDNCTCHQRSRTSDFVFNVPSIRLLQKYSDLSSKTKLKLVALQMVENWTRSAGTFANSMGPLFDFFLYLNVMFNHADIDAPYCQMAILAPTT